MKKNSTIPLISTIIVSLLAIVLAVIAIFTLAGKPQDNNSGGDPVSQPASFQPTQELVEECTYAAHDLVAASYRVIRLFVTEGLPYYEEHYGNDPEDNIYTVNSTEYTALADIENFVRSVYTESEAQRILHNIDGKGTSVYLNREVLVEVEQPEPSTEEGTAESSTSEQSPAYTTQNVLGINAAFVPDAEYGKDWSSCRIAVLPKSENECELTVYLDGLDENTEITDANKASVLTIGMLKTEAGWRLTALAY